MRYSLPQQTKDKMDLKRSVMDDSAAMAESFYCRYATIFKDSAHWAESLLLLACLLGLQDESLKTYCFC